MQHGGQTYPCPRTLGALCRHHNYTFLPCTQTPRTMITDAPPPFHEFWVAETKCAKYQTLYDFDVLPCDLTNGASILWSDGHVSVQHDQDMAHWPNLCVLLIMVWLIINLGESIALILEVKGSERHHHNTVDARPARGPEHAADALGHPRRRANLLGLGRLH